MKESFEIRFATEADIPLIFSFIKALAEYEKLSHAVITTEDILRKNLFGEKKYAEVIIGYWDEKPVSFAIFFHNFSTFLGQPGIYLEDLFVIPEARGHGLGKKLLAFLAKLTKERNCGRLEWCVLDWNQPAIDFYKRIGAIAMDDWSIYRIIGPALDNLAKS